MSEVRVGDIVLYQPTPMQHEGQPDTGPWPAIVTAVTPLVTVTAFLPRATPLAISTLRIIGANESADGAPGTWRAR